MGSVTKKVKSIFSFMFCYLIFFNVWLNLILAEFIYRESYGMRKNSRLIETTLVVSHTSSERSWRQRLTVVSKESQYHDREGLGKERQNSKKESKTRISSKKPRFCLRKWYQTCQINDDYSGHHVCVLLYNFYRASLTNEGFGEGYSWIFS